MPKYLVTYAAFMGSCNIEAESVEEAEKLFDDDPNVYVDPDGDEFFVMEIKEIK